MLRGIKALVILSIASTSSLGGPITVPNFSFESPPVTRDEENPFGALPYIDDWDETEVGSHDEFDQNTGVFLNTEPEEADYITNAHLDRLAFLSSLIGNDIRQELEAVFLPRHSYTLTVAVGKSNTFPVGADEELEIALFYFDGGVEQVVASTRVSGSQVGTTSLSDVTVTIPYISPEAVWANLPIGILIRPAVDDPDDEEGEGFWNVDHVRLVSSDGEVPAVSTWGLAITMLLLATMGTILMGRRTVQV